MVMMYRQSQPDNPVLVFEYGIENESAVSAVLGQYGFRFAVAGNLDEGLTMIGDLNPDLILLNVDDGHAVCRAIRAAHPGRDLKIIIITDRTETSAIEQAFSAGADDFVGKPFNEAELMVRVRNCLLSQRIKRDREGWQQDTGSSGNRAGQHPDQLGPENDRRLSCPVDHSWGDEICQREQVLQQINRLTALFQNEFRPFALILCQLTNIYDSSRGDCQDDFAADAVKQKTASIVRRCSRGNDVVGVWDETVLA
ncbi:MAG: response regulator, partial [Negativicutes bacterium]|nr:response regulator [Negativicutes bacterium]